MMTTPNQVRVPNVVLFDIMTEAATRVRGALIALTDKYPANADTYLRADITLMDQIGAVNPDDREQILTTTTALRAELDRLTAA